MKDVIDVKDRLIREQVYLRISLVSSDEIVKEASHVTNVENNESGKGKLKLVIPIIFIFIYMFASFYKTQSLRKKQ